MGKQEQTQRVWRAVIDGPPQGKGRPKATIVNGRPRMHTPAATRSWERDAAIILREAFGDSVSIDGPVSVTVLAIAARPKRLLRKKDPDGLLWRMSKPDGDNVLKACLDALVIGRIIRDDVQVVVSQVWSLYAERDGHPRVEVSWSLRHGETLDLDDFGKENA